MHTNATSTLDNSMLLASPYYYSKMARSPDGRWQKSKAAKACSWTQKKNVNFLDVFETHTVVPVWEIDGAYAVFSQIRVTHS